MPAELRPMSLGELLDRAFSLYRQHFWVFVGIVALPQLIVFALQIARVVVHPQSTAMFAAMGVLWVLVTLVAALGAVAASQGATVIAVSQVHLGRPTSIASAFAGIKGRILYIALIMIGVGIGVGVGFVLLIIPGIILALMWSLAIPVAVLEDTGLRDSTSRSSELTKGARGRIFLIYVLYFVLLYVVMMLWEIPLMAGMGIFSGAHHVVPPMWTLIGAPLGTYLTECLVNPLLTIILTLVYYDQKVRKEAFDLQHMMSLLDASPGSATASATV